MLFGDSLTEFGNGYHWKYPSDKKGWVPLLAELYSRKVRLNCQLLLRFSFDFVEPYCCYIPDYVRLCI
jgi:hypothetical protein